MSTLTIPNSAATRARRPSSPPVKEFIPPAERFCGLPNPSTLPADNLGREIAVLLHEHPELAAEQGPIDLVSLSVEAKVELLSRIKTALKIPVFRRKHLGYVGL